MDPGAAKRREDAQMCHSASFKNIQTDLESLQKMLHSGVSGEQGQTYLHEDGDDHLEDSCSKLGEGFARQVRDVTTESPHALGQTLLQIKQEMSSALSKMQMRFDAFAEAQNSELADVRQRLATLQPDAALAYAFSEVEASARRKAELTEIEMSARRKAERTIVDICGLMCEQLRERCHSERQRAASPKGESALMIHLPQLQQQQYQNQQLQQQQQQKQRRGQQCCEEVEALGQASVDDTGRVAACLGDAIQLLMEAHCLHASPNVCEKTAGPHRNGMEDQRGLDNGTEHRLREELIALVEEMAAQSADRHEALESKLIERMHRIQAPESFPASPMSNVSPSHPSIGQGNSGGGSAGGGRGTLLELNEWVSLYDEAGSCDSSSPCTHSCVATPHISENGDDSSRVERRLRKMEEWAHKLQAQLHEERHQIATQILEAHAKLGQMRLEFLGKVEEVWGGIKLEHQERCEEYLALTGRMDAKITRLAASLESLGHTPSIEGPQSSRTNLDMQIDDSIRVLNDVAAEVAMRVGPASADSASSTAHGWHVQGGPSRSTSASTALPSMLPTAFSDAVPATRRCRSSSTAEMQGASSRFVKVVPPESSHIKARSGSPRVMTYSGVAEEAQPRRVVAQSSARPRRATTVELSPRMAISAVVQAAPHARVNNRSTSPIGVARNGGFAGVGAALSGGSCGGSCGSLASTSPAAVAVAPLFSPIGRARCRNVGVPANPGAASAPSQRRPEVTCIVPPVPMPTRVRGSAMAMQHSSSAGSLAATQATTHAPAPAPLLRASASVRCQHRN